MAINALTLAALIAFWTRYPDAEQALRDWYRVIRQADFATFADVKATFPGADWVAGFIVFDIMGNRYRLVVRPNFSGKRFYIRGIYMHKEYDAWTQEMRSR